MQWKKMLVIDVECTCFQDNDSDKPKGWTQEKDQEIIEFGAVLVNMPDQTIEASKSFLVKPTGPMGQFCEELTSLTAETVKDAPDLTGSIQEMKSWCREHKFDMGQMPWGSWGDYDRVQLFRECMRKSVKYPFGRAHYNIKGLFSMMRGTVKGFGVGKALSVAGMEFEGRPHRGIDDAKMIAELLVQQVLTTRVETTRNSRERTHAVD